METKRKSFTTRFDIETFELIERLKDRWQYRYGSDVIERAIREVAERENLVDKKDTLKQRELS